MRRSFVWLLALAPSVAFADFGGGGSMAWSPDGRWLAYTVTVDATPPLPPPDWLFTSGRGVKGGLEVLGGFKSDRPRRSRIYATDTVSDVSTVLEDSTGLVTSPAWSPDGRALAFVRLTTDARGSGRSEVVVQEGPGQKRVILSRAVARPLKAPDDVAALTLAWSPDGRYLAVPDGSTEPGLLVVRADTGGVLKTLPQAVWPAWSPDGTRFAFLSVGKSAGLQLMDTSFGPPRQVAELGRVLHAPSWSRDGKSILAVALRPVGRGRGLPPSQLEVLRISPDVGSSEAVSQLLAGDKPPKSVSYTVDRDAEEMFSAANVEGQQTAVVWFHPKTKETVDRFHPVDFSLEVGSLAMSPGGRFVAMRLGPGGSAAPAALWEPAAKRLSPLVPDDATRLKWLSLLTTTAGRLLQVTLPQAAVQGRAIDRPTVLPVPGEVPPNQEVAIRFRKIARIGRSLCDRPAGEVAGEPAVETFLAEARLFFDVLREDYPSALTSLEAVEGRADSPDVRLRLLAVRAQLFLGLKDVDRAKDTISYLEQTDLRPVSRLETTPAGSRLTPEPAASAGWSRYLAIRANDVAKSRDKSEPEDDEMTGAPGQGLPFPRDQDAVVLPLGRDDMPDVRVRFGPPRRNPMRPGPPPVMPRANRPGPRGR